MGTDALEKWGEDRFKPMVMLAQTVAVNVEPCHALIVAARGNRFFSVPETRGIQLQDWLRLYHRQSWVEGVMLHLAHAPEEVDDLDEAREESTALQHTINGSLRDALEQALTGGISERTIRGGQRRMERYYRRAHLPMIERMLHGGEPIPESAKHWLARPEFVFFYEVAVPCWLEFKVTPWVLYREARKGKICALEDLLRLDPEADKDEELAKQVFRIRQQEPNQYKLLQEARHEGLKSAVSVADVKFLLGGLLMKWSKEWHALLQGEVYVEAMQVLAPPEEQATLAKKIKRFRQRAARSPVKCWLKAPDIKRLFDAVARDSCRGPSDPDFSQQSNSYYKRLAHYAGLWPSLRKADKKLVA